MSSLVYKNQSVAELEYKFYKSCDLRYNFNILENKIVHWRGIILEFSIIGASHYVKIKSGVTENFTELLACVKSSNKVESNLLCKDKLINNETYCHQDKINDRMIYEFESEVIDDSVKNYKGFQEKYMNKQNNYFDFVFPARYGLAITSIDIKKKDDRIKWITYHSYPEDHKIIKTLSYLSFQTQGWFQY